MHYKFPEIRHLDQIRPAIEGRNEFIIAERDWGFVVNYMVSMADTFPDVVTEYDAIRRECRGLLFHRDGTIMARRLHKFFNVNERDETQHHLVDLAQPHVILDKLDGSMITPVVTEHGLRWGTKMGITQVSMQAEEWVATRPDIASWAERMLAEGWTPIFEWCSRKQRIVVDYVIDRLVLIAVRRTVEGTYMSYEDMRAEAEGNALDVVRAYAGTTANMEHLIAETRAAEGIEGWIIRFDTGQMVKVKGDWYVRIHKTKDALVHEKNVVELLVNEQLDDVKAFMLDDDRRRIEAFETDFWQGVSQVVRGYEQYYDTVVAQGLDRKRFALEWMPTIKAQDPHAPGIVFGRFDGRDTRAMVLDIIKRSTGSQTKIDEARHLWGGSRWNYQFDGDA
jgi:RNA ligase